MRTALLLSILLADGGSTVDPPKGCKIIARWSFTVTVACPASTTPAELAAWVPTLKAKKSHGNLMVFSSDGPVPRELKEVDAMSLEQFHARLLAELIFNEKTHLSDFTCKRSASDPAVSPCNDLIR